MDVEAWRGAADLFEDLDDPRVVGRCKHRLTDIVMIALVGLIGPCEDYEDVAEFGRVNETWFKRFLTLENGVPSHDTFARVLGLLDPGCMNRCFERWLTHLVRCLDPDKTSAKTIAIDGKVLRASRSVRGHNAQDPLHLVNAWAHESGLVLGQVACGGSGGSGTSGDFRGLPGASGGFRGQGQRDHGDPRVAGHAGS